MTNQCTCNLDNITERVLDADSGQSAMDIICGFCKRTAAPWKLSLIVKYIDSQRRVEVSK